jgi:hypothetical protein
MKTLVVYESMFGNTEQMPAVAAGIGETVDVQVTEVADAPTDPGFDVALIVAGGPTHAFSMSRENTRADAISKGAHEGEREFGLREWMAALPSGEHTEKLATFDTKIKSFCCPPQGCRKWERCSPAATACTRRSATCSPTRPGGPRCWPDSSPPPSATPSPLGLSTPPSPTTAGCWGWPCGSHLGRSPGAPGASCGRCRCCLGWPGWRPAPSWTSRAWGQRRAAASPRAALEPEDHGHRARRPGPRPRQPVDRPPGWPGITRLSRCIDGRSGAQLLDGQQRLRAELAERHTAALTAEARATAALVRRDVAESPPSRVPTGDRESANTAVGAAFPGARPVGAVGVPGT